MEKGYELNYTLFVTSDFIHNFFLHNLIKFYSLYYEEDKENELLILQIPKTEIRNYDDSNKYNTLFYVFKSLKSDKIVTLWDSS